MIRITVIDAPLERMYRLTLFINVDGKEMRPIGPIQFGDFDVLLLFLLLKNLFDEVVEGIGTQTQANICQNQPTGCATSCNSSAIWCESIS
jgi:hypothetical protein